MKASRRSQARGFTLIELMVALAAGVVLLMWMTQLSGMVMQTYQDEARSYAAETSLRVASERLRSDLQSAGYMSSPNANTDPLLARATTTANPGTQWDADGSFVGITNLAGLRYELAGSEAADVDVANASNLTANALDPDAIRITGNLTTADEYIGMVSAEAVPDSGGANCNNGIKIRLSNDDPAVLRLKGASTVAADVLLALKRAFLPTEMPYAGGSTFGPNAGRTFLARVVDPTGKFFNIAPICGVEYDEPTQTAFVVLYHSKSLVTAEQSAGLGSGISGFAPVVINPVQTVRWRIRRRADTSLDRDTADPRFELIREWIAADDQPMGNPEVVADYIVDLKFAFTVTGTPPLLSPPSDLNLTWGSSAAATYMGTTPTTKFPQRVRRVRFRIQARNAVPDTDATVAGPGAGYLYRYQVGTNRFARVRTLTSEVALVNHSRLW